MLHLRWRWIGGVDDVGGEWLDGRERGNLVAGLELIVREGVGRIMRCATKVLGIRRG
jgi:hypothetical protein